MTEPVFELLACDANGRRERPFEGVLNDGEHVRLRTGAKASEILLAQVPDVDIRAVALVHPSKHTHDEVRLVLDRFPKLEELRISEAKGVTDETCQLIAAQLPNVRRLHIMMSGVGDEGAKAVATLKDLESLSITNARLTDVGLEALGNIRSLRRLQVDGNFKIEGAGLASFVDHPALEEIWLPGTRIGDTSIAYLSGCTKLVFTFLRSTAVTAACVRLLPQIPMAYVDLPNNLDPADVDAARRDCPDLIVDGHRFADVNEFRAAAAESAGAAELPAILRRDVLTLAILSGPNCQPCVILKRELSNVRPSLREQYRLVEIDVDQEPDVAAALNVRTIPTTFVFVEGREAARFSGAALERQLTPLLETWANY